ncbi:helix-turn-helix transcriptional regulator [Tsukamurella tyrosinosolvens]|uniref:helix-turn-helix transcriptional regulator n=1 Tax=Tsukamurella tyrosinosolvens TaxID=57704 RepID=UPI002DD424CF|nr:helix-turn-helix transcriptional regulator [Tsukamurella tyrosinosolvens]MEC4616193.1 helix-turn-helix transcriptional regulator [Tsukamurella tyrosinosolvens]
MEPLEVRARVHEGAAVRALRLAYGWQLGRFAVAVGVTHGHMANIEAGRKNLTLPLARRMADTLGVPLAALTSNYDVEEIAGPLGSAA